PAGLSPLAGARRHGLLLGGLVPLVRHRDADRPLPSAGLRRERAAGSETAAARLGRPRDVRPLLHAGAHAAHPAVLEPSPPQPPLPTPSLPPSPGEGEIKTRRTASPARR